VLEETVQLLAFHEGGFNPVDVEEVESWLVGGEVGREEDIERIRLADEVAYAC
jgi:hypothetical protein